MGDCEIRWCKSGKSATRHVNENIGDGCFRVTICESCFAVLEPHLNYNRDLPSPVKVKAVLAAASIGIMPPPSKPQS